MERILQQVKSGFTVINKNGKRFVWKVVEPFNESKLSETEFPN